MARVPYLDQQDLAAEHRDLLKRSVNIFGRWPTAPTGCATSTDSATSSASRAGWTRACASWRS